MIHGAFTKIIWYFKLQKPLDVQQILFREETDVCLPHF